MRFTFNSKFVGLGSPETSVSFEADDIDSVLMYFEDFLRGAGYHFEGSIQLVTDEIPHNDEELPFANYGGERCGMCNLTRQEMGQSKCYDPNCGLGLQPKPSSGIMR